MINKLKQHLPLLLLLLLSVLTFSTLLRPGYFPMHDDQQAIRLFEMDKCVKDGQIPCRWVPDMGYGYGYPQFNYYSPLPYYSMEAFHLIGLGFLDSVKAGFILSILASTIGMYFLGRNLWGKWGGFLSGLFYSYAPYKAVDLFVRGAVGELFAFIFLPLIFLSIKKVLEGNKKWTIFITLSLAGLLMSHNITSLIFAPFIVLWIIFLIFIQKLKSLPDFKHNFFWTLLGLIWGISISAFFVLPALIEAKFVHIESLTSGYFNYLAHFVSINQLLFSMHWGYGFSMLGPYDDISLSVGIIHWILPLILIFTAIYLRKKRELQTILLFTLFGWISLFMIHEKSSFIWKLFSGLSIVQFPWRFLVLAIFFFSVSVGALAVFLPKRKLGMISIILALVFLEIIFYSSNFKPVSWLNIMDKEKFSGSEWVRQQTVSILDYLPKSASHAPDFAAPNGPTISIGKGTVQGGEKGTNWQKWQIDINSSEARVILPIYYFPVWKVWVDNKEITFEDDNELGMITFNLDKGSHSVYAKLTDTPIRKIGDILSMIGILGIIAFLVKRPK